MKLKAITQAFSWRRQAFILLAWLVVMSTGLPLTFAGQPRIVNIYNFIRNSDFRLPDSETDLYEATRHQIQLIEPTGLPATWALQYDALINPRYQKLLKEQLSRKDEIAAWWEIPKPLAEKAGIKWRGQHDWDPSANVGFSSGYTPEERRKLVDVYMADFKAIFGNYPRTVGSWYIDEVTLAYMSERYHIVASCNCKDQIGTDFYTLWGGYWNQAYYPSRVNAYMPAQTRAGQIDVPIFRMLGSDPIYEHGTTPGLQSLESVYPESGGSPKWVAWFVNNLINQPALAFGYAQAGQENSFGWGIMKNGLTNQIAVYAAQARAGTIRVETLAQSGEWFKKHYRLTPATAVVAMDDWKEQGRKTVWYDSRYYRLNVLWENGAFFIRDLHCFDENIISPTHAVPLTETSLTYETLPIVDWAFWSKAAGTEEVGMRPVLLSADGSDSSLRPAGTPVIKELNSTDLSIQQPLDGGGTFTMVCREKEITFSGLDLRGKPLNWAWNIAGGAPLAASVKKISTTGIAFSHAGVDYHLILGSSADSCRQLENGIIQLTPDATGKLVFKLDPASVAAVTNSK